MKALKGYILTIFGPDEPDEVYVHELENNVLTGRALGDAEDVINDQLPEGFQAKISEASLLRQGKV